MVVFLTDGYVGNDFEILDLIHRSIADARLFAFGVGSSVNRFLLTEMGRVGRGFSRFMDPTEDVGEVVDELAQRLQAPVLTDIRIDWGELQASAVTPDPLPDLFAGQSLRLMGRYQQPGTYQITVHGNANGHKASLPLQINLTEISTDGDAVTLTWARTTIKQALHQLTAPRDLRIGKLRNNTLKQQITQLGLDYSLVTQWTAFVAVSEKIYNQNPTNTPTLPVPLQQVAGVSEHAYSKSAQQPKQIKPIAQPAPMQIAQAQPTNNFAGNAAPEPATWLGMVLMLALAGLMRVWVGRRALIS